jgi:outer membrane immunogenic protein
MRKLVLAAASLLVAGSALVGQARAADLPARAAPPMLAPVAPIFTWTGWNFGFLTGYAFTDRQNVRTVGNNGAGIAGVTNTQLNVAQLRRPPNIRLEDDGFTNIGANLGYDYQFTPGNGIVVGVATDITWTDLSRYRAYLSPAQAANGFIPDPSVYRQSLDFLGTVRGRVGYAFDRFLVYGTGGFAYGGVEYKADFFRNTDNARAYAGRYDRIETGYAYGGGIEYAIPTDSFLARFSLLSLLGYQSQAITLKAEYLRYDLGSRNVLVQNTGIGPTGSYTSRFTTEGSIVRGGLTYRFGSF